MGNSLEVIENIMKPYFDKKKAIEEAPIALENEKTEYASNISNLKNERISRIKELEVELENLRVRNKITIEDYKEKMNREIEEYVSNAMNTNSNFFTNYGVILRKDLEQQYNERLKELEENLKEKEQSLIDEIKSLKMVSAEEKNEQQELDFLNKKSSYRRVDLRELVEIKDNLRKQLIAEQKILLSKKAEYDKKVNEYNQNLEELKQYQLDFNKIMEKISNFKYQYDDQGLVINNDDFKKLCDESVLISEKIKVLTNKLTETSKFFEVNDIEMGLNKIEEYLELTTLTSEEAAAVMRSMTPWEKEEYDRRKQAIILKTKENEKIDEQNEEEIEIPEIEIGEIEEEIETPEIETPEEEIEETEMDTPEKDIEVPEVENSNSDIIEIDDPIISKYEENDGNIVVDNVGNLIKTIYNAVIEESQNLRTIKLNKSKGALAENEFYLSSKENNEEYELNGATKFSNDDAVKLPSGEYLYEEDINKAINNFYKKNKGINYVVKETDRNYKITKYNVEKLKRKLKKCSRVKLIKENKISKFDLLKVFGKKKSEKMLNEINISNLKGVKVPEGEYVNREDIVINMSNLFKTNEKNWLKSFSDSLKKKQEERNRKRQEEQDYILEIDDDYIIKK